jgi:NRPS condensation-like uncharacterized protein
MTSATAIPPVAGPGWRPASSPFSPLDELNCYFDSAAEPNNVHLEAWLPGHLSPQRLSAATAAVLATVPAARGRRAAGPWWRADYAWEVPPEADIDPVSVTSCRDDAELNLARARFLAAAPELDRSPPFRLLLAQGPSWDSVILNAHHAAFDGRSCLRLLSMIADCYGGGQPWEASGPERAGVAARSGGLAAACLAGSEPRAGGLPLPARRSARIAPQHADARLARGAPGYGLSFLTWPGVPMAPESRGGSRVTVNDLLIAALIQAIAQWNTARHRRPAQVRISMPMDTRPPGHGHELGNLSRLCTVTLDPDSVTDWPAAVADQTRRAKMTSGPLAGPLQMTVARTRLPVPLKRGVVRLGLHSLGRIRCDSSLLSNLGSVTDPPRFGALAPACMWFSTSAHMPRGLSVGAITVGGQLQLCFRYRTALLDYSAGREFAAEFAAALSSLSAPAGGRAGG